MIRIKGARILVGDAREQLKKIPDNHIHCCVTSPPFFDLRTYGVAQWADSDIDCDHIGYGQCEKCGTKRLDTPIGNESSIDDYLNELMNVFLIVYDKLRDDGTLWVEIGSTYNNGRDSSYDKKELLPIPWLFALRMREIGWKFRQDIIWHKPNPLPGMVNDRCQESHTYMLLFYKKDGYYFDHIAIQQKPTHNERDIPGARTNKRSVWAIPVGREKNNHFASFPHRLIKNCILAGTSQEGCCKGCGASYKRVAETTIIHTRKDVKSKYKDAEHQKENKMKFNRSRGVTIHKTIGWEPTCDCDANVTSCRVLDPFLGTGTTIASAIKLGRAGVGCELYQEHVDIAIEKIEKAYKEKGFGLLGKK